MHVQLATNTVASWTIGWPGSTERLQCHRLDSFSTVNTPLASGRARQFGRRRLGTFARNRSTRSIMQQRVAVLSHVKTSSVPPSRNDSSARRIAWHGGKISSNKTEALQKFYQRKLRAGDCLTPQQIEAIQATRASSCRQVRDCCRHFELTLFTYGLHAQWASS